MPMASMVSLCESSCQASHVALRVAYFTSPVCSLPVPNFLSLSVQLRCFATPVNVRGKKGTIVQMLCLVFQHAIPYRSALRQHYITVNPTMLKMFGCSFPSGSLLQFFYSITLEILPKGPFDVIFVTYRYLDSDVLQMVWQTRYVHQMQPMLPKTSTQLWKI